jgi:hypothetical protein
MSSVSQISADLNSSLDIFQRKEDLEMNMQRMCIRDEKIEGEFEFPELLKNLICQQKVINNYSNYQQYGFLLRGSMIEWIYIINSKLGGSDETLFKAISILDNYFMRNFQQLEKERLQLISAVCYFIASKTEEVMSFDILFLQNTILKNKFSQEEIRETEIEILKKISFRLHRVNIHNFTELLIENSKRFVKNDEMLKLFAKMNNFVNILSLLVEELIFDMEPFKIAVINFKTTIQLLEYNQCITSDEVEMLEKTVINLYSKYAKKFYTDLSIEEDLFPIANSLMEAIIQQEESPNKKAFFSIYFECLQ